MKDDIYIQHLLKKIAKNDRNAFDLFFEYYYPRLLKFAVYFVKNYENAEEVVSDVLVKLLNNRAKLASIENFNAYIFQSVKNQCLSWRSKKKPQLFPDATNEEDFLMIEKSNPETDLLHKEMINSIQEAIGNLPPKRKKIYLLIKEDGLSYQDVADLLDISKKTVEVHMGLAIANIRESLNQYLNDDSDNTPIRKIIKVLSPFTIISQLLMTSVL